MSPEQVQSHDLTNRSDLYSLGAVMYELLTGSRLFRAGNLAKLMHQIVYATPRADPHRCARMSRRAGAGRRDRAAEGSGQALSQRRGFRCRADPRAPEAARASGDMDQTEQMALLRKLKFFHDFSQAEIREVLKASVLAECAPNEEIVKEGDMDDRFYVVVAGNCSVERNGRIVGQLGTGDCFGESSYLPGARRSATVRSTGQCHRAQGAARRCWSRCHRPASCGSTRCSCARSSTGCRSPSTRPPAADAAYRPVLSFCTAGAWARHQSAMRLLTEAASSPAADETFIARAMFDEAIGNADRQHRQRQRRGRAAVRPLRSRRRPAARFPRSSRRRASSAPARRIASSSRGLTKRMSSTVASSASPAASAAGSSAPKFRIESPERPSRRITALAERQGGHFRLRLDAGARRRADSARRRAGSSVVAV